MGKTVNLNAYFERIGFSGSIAPNAATLELLHALHSAHLPFENLDPLMGLPVSLELEAIERKLVGERRGGYCYEHNLLFMAVLKELDFTVRGLAARVLWNNPQAVDAKPTHMLLAVDIGGTTFLADPGFGGLAPTAPLKLRADTEQKTPHDTYRLGETEGQWQLEARTGEDWRPLYAFDLTERQLGDYEAANALVGNDPASPFTHELRAAFAPPGRRLTLRNNHLTIRAEGEEAQTRLITDLADLRDVLATSFTINLPTDERLDAKLAAILAAAETP